MDKRWRLFWKDLLIGTAITAATIICFIYNVPILGHPIALLVGPFVGVCLSLEHNRP